MIKNRYTRIGIEHLLVLAAVAFYQVVYEMTHSKDSMRLKNP
jgi:hypothetical protein